MEKMSSQELDQLGDIEEQYIDNNVIKKYRFSSQGLDTNYYPTGSMQIGQNRTMKWNMDELEIKLEYNIDTGKVKSIIVDGKDLNIPELSDIPTIKQNRRKNINISLIEAMIKNKLNPCE